MNLVMQNKVLLLLCQECLKTKNYGTLKYLVDDFIKHDVEPSLAHCICMFIEHVEELKEHYEKIKLYRDNRLTNEGI
jgi:hypothetical protein